MTAVTKGQRLAVCATCGAEQVCSAVAQPPGWLSMSFASCPATAPRPGPNQTPTTWGSRSLRPYVDLMAETCSPACDKAWCTAHVAELAAYSEGYLAGLQALAVTA